MLFDDTVAKIRTLSDMRRIAGAHVVDHRQLSDEELKSGIIRVKPQYLHRETVQTALEALLIRDVSKDVRVIVRALLIDVLLDQYDFSAPFAESEEKVIAFEQSIVDRSNEIELEELACGDSSSRRFRDLSMYHFVLSVAWEHHDSVSPDEANLLRRLRDQLRINERDHRLLEAKLGKYPKPENELHTRSEIADVRRRLQAAGLLFPVRLEDGTDVDVVPQELAHVIRSINGTEIRTEPYRQLLQYRRIRRKDHLSEVLTRNEIPYSRYDTLQVLTERVVNDVPPSGAIASGSPRYGLSSDELTAWCRELNLSVSGSIEDKVTRIIQHFDQLRPRLEADVDQRELWYQYYEELARREYDTLRAQHVIDKDLEIEHKFEEATRFLFATRLNHAPLRQSGSNHPDGLVSLRSDYLMWDNKSKESSSPVNLKEHLSQFDQYMNQADKRVPIFLVIGHEFTPESETEAIRYHAQHFDRNLVLITASALKSLAEEWASSNNKNREEPFPLGLMAASGRFDRTRIGKLY